jgi:hypothetical protein
MKLWAAMPALRLAVAVVVLAVSTLAAHRVSADTTPEDRALSAQLTESITHEASRAFVWRATWTAINAALALASTGALYDPSASGRPTLIISAIASGVSGALTWGFPLEVEADARRAVQLARLPWNERRERLQELYTHAAQDESDRVQWPWHLINLGLSLVPAVIIWAGYQRFEDGLIMWLGGLTIGELTLLTQPTRLADQKPTGLALLRLSCDRNRVAVSYAFAW